MRYFDGITLDADLAVLHDNLGDLINETLWLLDFNLTDLPSEVCPLSLEPCRQLLNWLLEETPPFSRACSK